MTMALLQTCGYVTEQMQTQVTMDINKFLEAFSIQVDGCRIQPPSWTQSQQDSASTRPHTTIGQASTSIGTNFFDMDNYRTSRQGEAIRWINLQERRSSIISRLQPTTAEEYQSLRDAVTSDGGPLRRKVKKASGMKFTCKTAISLTYISRDQTHKPKALPYKWPRPKAAKKNI